LPNKAPADGLQLPLTSDVEAVEKVPKQILGRDAEKSDLLECATINDLILGQGQVTPENIVVTGQKDFFYRLVRNTIKCQKLN
jgi:hypothetical protein